MSPLNKALWTNLTKLKLLSKEDTSVRFLLDRSPFDDEQEERPTEQKVHVIIGRIFPKSDLYKDYAIQIEMKLTSTYPTDPPEVRLLTQIYHPNIDKDGKFCHALLMRTVRWKPGTTLVDVVRTVVDYIDHPDIDYAVNFGQSFD